MITKLLSFPFRAVTLVGEKIKEEVDRELYDVDHIQRQLLNLEMLYEMQEIPEDEYREKEEQLLERYEIAKTRELEQWKASRDDSED